MPLFVGEFGAPSDGYRADEYVELFYQLFDANMVSAAQWNFTPHWTPTRYDGWNDENFSIVDDHGALRPTYRVRAYAARIAGDASSFDPSQGELQWTHDPIPGETRIFAPLASFGGSASMEVTGDAQCAYDAVELYVRCTAPTSGAKRVRLQPCAAGATGCVTSALGH